MDKYVAIREECLIFIRTGLLNITDIFILTLKNRFEFILHGQHTKFFPVEWFIPFFVFQTKEFRGILQKNPFDFCIQKEIARLTSDLLPKPTNDDKWGQSENFDILIERLNQCNCIEATKVCYACICTLPPQSEVKLAVTHNKELIIRIMDILTDDDEPLKYLGLHDE